ncbi:SET domain-containing protein 4 isoform X3 [Eptesicus fuscus]|uniref:SET domain-containing protein 4 isoform X3 n=1 Tax=Eptesicus fuscus TaxID=29078 RepID=UPI0024048E8D|nr:SET domain-containing protein 4 isoform X3 [Eptesicus fuscus]
MPALRVRPGTRAGSSSPPLVGTSERRLRARGPLSFLVRDSGSGDGPGRVRASPAEARGGEGAPPGGPGLGSGTKNSDYLTLGEGEKKCFLFSIGHLNRNCSCSMKKGRGRTSRIRRRKLCRSSQSRGVNESYKPEFIALKKWLKARKFEDTNLIPASFPDTGRGLMSKTSLQPLLSEAAESVFSYGAFLWAWCTVNTRAVYMTPGRRQGLSAEPDTCALAPFLDLLNHSPAVQVEAAFNEESRRYEIRTRSGCRRHEEVLICYGAHDSRRLLLEYGFVPRGNPHACVPVSQDMLVKYLPSTDKQMNKKISILKDHDFIENLTFGWDGPSWRLLTALRLLCLEAGEFLCWKKVLLGEIISDVNEKKSLDIAQKICHYFTEEASAMLQKVSHMKDKEMALTHQLTLVETLWTEELKILRASAETLSRLQTAVRDSPRGLRPCRPRAGCDA